MYEYSYRVYRAFLEYLYTDEVRLNPEDGFELLVLADAYCESHLKSECERLIRTSLASENVLSQYMQAIQFSAKVRFYYLSCIFRFDMYFEVLVYRMHFNSVFNDNCQKKFDLTKKFQILLCSYLYCVGSALILSLIYCPLFSVSRGVLLQLRCKKSDVGRPVRGLHVAR